MVPDIERLEDRLAPAIWQPLGESFAVPVPLPRPVSILAPSAPSTASAPAQSSTALPMAAAGATFIVDFGNTAYSEPAGTWSQSSLLGQAGTTSRVSSNTNALARWTVPGNVPAGAYRLSFFNVVQAGSTTQARVTLIDNGQVAERILNQATGASDWVTLGVFDLDGVGNERIELTNGAGTGALRADAVRLEQVMPATAAIIDSPDPLYSEPTGVWADSTVTGQNGTTSRVSSTPTAKARWNVPADLATGPYRVSFFRVATSGNTTQARVQVTHAGGVATTDMNQQSGTSGWVSLGVFEFSGTGSEFVELTNFAGSGNLRADAIRFEREHPTRVVDDADAEYSEIAGTWGQSPLLGQGGTTVRASASANAAARWAFPPNLAPGLYQVSFFKVQAGGTTTQARVRVEHSAGTTDTNVNLTTGSSGWVGLGTFRFDGDGAEFVEVTKVSGGNLRADSVRFEPNPVRVVDNADAQYSEIAGVWGQSSLLGQGGTTVRASASANAAARWTLPPTLGPGRYQVSFFKVQAAGTTTLARLRVTHSAGTTDVIVNLTTGTSGWVNLGTFVFDGDGTESVELTKVSGGNLRADAVRFEASPIRIVDNVDPEYSEIAGVWGQSALLGQGGTTVRASASANAAARWVLPANLGSGFYQVSFFKVQAGGAATQIRLRVSHSAGTTDRFVDLAAGTSGWVTLGTFGFDGDGTESVELTKVSGGNVRADAVRFERIEPVTTVLIDDPKPQYAEPIGVWSQSAVLGQSGTTTRVSSTSSANARWYTPPSLTSGNYRVSFFRVVNSGSTTQARVRVVHGAGVTDTMLNLTTGVSGWVDLGVFSFNGDGSEFVELTNAAGTGNLRADAVRFEPALVADGELTIYDIAIATTAEFTSLAGGSVATSTFLDDLVADINEIYGQELAINFELIPNNDSLIFTNAGTDGFTNGDAGTMIGQSQAIIDGIVGAAAYDIGHVLGTQTSGGGGGNGLAQLGSVGTANKARGVTLASLTDFVFDVILHEIGHQFSANHSFNGPCGDRNAATSVEPGGGSTIMGYSVCSTSDLPVLFGDFLYFHANSREEVFDFVDTIPSVGTVQSTENTKPTANAGANVTIPASTPFTLTAVANDANPEDLLTYTWEQMDIGGASAQAIPIPNAADNIGPLFRSFAPNTAPSRTFPRMTDILANTAQSTNEEEHLPTQSRTMNFRVTVRDNFSFLDGGNLVEASGLAFDDVVVTVVNTGAPFRVTTLNSATNLSGGSLQTITWDVAGTTANGINTANVKIFLSTDGGLTFPFELATTANDGSHALTLPNIAASQARIKVQGSGNVFFDVNDANFSITANPAAAGLTITESSGLTLVREGNLTLAPATDTYTIRLNTAPTSAVQVTITANPQSELSANGTTFSSSVVLSLNSTAASTITVRSINDSGAEGLHTSRISHQITSSSDANYPTSMLVNDVLAQISDDELPPLVGADFQATGDGETPTNWTLFNDTIFSSVTRSNLIREDGVSSPYDLTVAPQGTGYSFGGGASDPDFSTIPLHNPFLEGIDGVRNWLRSGSATVTATWSGLTAGAQYRVYVFALETFGGIAASQSVTITGADTAVFNQITSDAELLINGQTGDSSGFLESFGVVVTANGSGQITITISRSNGVDNNRLYLAGLAIQEVVAGAAPL